MTERTKQAIKATAMGAFGGAVMSALISYFVVSFPATVAANALNNGMSGLMSGSMGGLTAILMLPKQFFTANDQQAKDNQSYKEKQKNESGKYTNK